MDAAALIIAQTRAKLAEALLLEFPYFKTAALDQLLETTTQAISDAVKEQIPAMEAAKSRMPFLSLSAELRNRIYEFVIPPQEVDLRRYRHTSKFQFIQDRRTQRPRYRRFVGPDVPQPAISKVSHQLRSETLPMYYGISTFKTEINAWNEQNLVAPGRESRKIQKWLYAIGPANARLIKKFELTVHERTQSVNSISDDDEMFTPTVSGPVVAAQPVDYFQDLGFAAAGIPNTAFSIHTVYHD